MHTLVKVGRFRGQLYSTSGQCWSIPGQFLSNADHGWPIPGQCWSSMADFGSKLAGIGPNLVEFWRNLSDRISLSFWQFWSISDRSLLRLARVGRLVELTAPDAPSVASLAAVCRSGRGPQGPAACAHRPRSSSELALHASGLVLAIHTRRGLDVGRAARASRDLNEVVPQSGASQRSVRVLC